MIHLFPEEAVARFNHISSKHIQTSFSWEQHSKQHHKTKAKSKQISHKIPVDTKARGGPGFCQVFLLFLNIKKPRRSGVFC
jgi:hypothetical protein